MQRRVVFAGHDPGAKNALRCIHKRTEAEGWHAAFIDLSTDPRPPIECACDVLVVGTSTNKMEVSWVQAARQRAVPVVMVLDLPGGLMAAEKLQPVSENSVADLYLVPDADTQTLVQQLLCDAGLVSRVDVAGSTHLEMLSQRPRSSPQELAAARARYCEPGTVLLTYLGCPAEPALGVDSEVVLAMTKELLISAAAACEDQRLSLCLLFRAHPRTQPELCKCVQSLCASADLRDALSVCFELSGEGGTNFELMQVSDAMLTHTSSMTTECAVMGTPCAFLSSGWAGASEFQTKCFGGAFGRIPRLANPSELAAFLSQCIHDGGRQLTEALCQELQIGQVQGVSALDVSWELISQLALTNTR